MSGEMIVGRLVVAQLSPLPQCISVFSTQCPTERPRSITLLKWIHYLRFSRYAGNFLAFYTFSTPRAAIL